jgi:hypothetical protein
MTDQDAYEMIASTLGPDAAVKIATNRMENAPKAQAAQAAMIDAIVKQQAAPLSYEKTRADIAKLRADVNKTNFDMSPDYVEQQGAIEGAKEGAKFAAKSKAEQEEFKQKVEEAGRIPIYEPTLRAQGFTNFGQLWQAMGKLAPEVVSAAIRSTADQSSAGMTAGALNRQALASVVTGATTRLAQLQKMQAPLAETDPMYSMQRLAVASGKVTLATPENVAEYNSLRNMLGAATKGLGMMGGISTTAPETGKYTPKEITVNGYKIPAKATYRVLPDGKVQYKLGGK